MPQKRIRIGHKKSRAGCLRCKARRVKCDEKRPCSNCLRHEVPCSLDSVQDEGTTPNTIPSPLAATVTEPGETKIPIRTPLSGGIGSLDAASNHTPPSGTISPPSPTQPDFTSHPDGDVGRTLPLLPPQSTGSAPHPYYSAGWMQSLRLMHHYSTVVCHSFSKVQGMGSIWGEAVPEMACSNETLMHSLLAVSAMHYATTHPDQKREYEIASAVYQDLALQQFSDQLANINGANCEALLIIGSFIYLLTMHSISNPPEGGPPLNPSDVARSFILMQGMKNIIDYQPAPQWTVSGPLAPLFQTFEVINVVRSGSFQSRLDKLTILTRELSSSWAVINPQSACLLAIESLRSSHAATVGDRSPLASRRVWIWPITLPQLFIEMFGNRHPLALLIVAHYAALVRPFEHMNWARIGWSKNVMDMVQRSLEGDDRMLKWMSWPMRAVSEDIEVDDMLEEDVGMS